MKPVGQIAYEKWLEHIYGEGHALTGRWDEVPEATRQNWTDVAEAVIAHERTRTDKLATGYCTYAGCTFKP